MTKNMKEILLPYGETREKIAKTFGVSAVTVRSALKGRTKSELAMRIRTMALQHGGSEVNNIKPIK